MSTANMLPTPTAAVFATAATVATAAAASELPLDSRLCCVRMCILMQ
jgi:hypothetical protein